MNLIGLNLKKWGWNFLMVYIFVGWIFLFNFLVNDLLKLGIFFYFFGEIFMVFVLFL